MPTAAQIGGLRILRDYDKGRPCGCGRAGHEPFIVRHRCPGMTAKIAPACGVGEGDVMMDGPAYPVTSRSTTPTANSTA